MRFLALSALYLLLLAASPGCGRKSEVVDEHRITTPDGETVIRDTREIEKSGSHKTPDRP